MNGCVPYVGKVVEWGKGRKEGWRETSRYRDRRKMKGRSRKEVIVVVLLLLLL